MPRIALLQSKTFETKDEAFDHHETLIRTAEPTARELGRWLSEK